MIVTWTRAWETPGVLWPAGWHVDRKIKFSADPKAFDSRLAVLAKLYVAVAVAKLVNDKQFVFG